MNFLLLQAASYPHIEEMLEGVILTSPALGVKPAHPIVGVNSMTPCRDNFDMFNRASV